MTNVVAILQERGLVEALTSDELASAASSKPLAVYAGFDPTADGLHLGNMVPMMGLAWFQRCGHTPVALIGGATGMIGDPSGRSSERNLLDTATLQNNLRGITRDLQLLLGHHKPEALFLNNADWIAPFSFLDFLRDVGKHFRVGVMLTKESVKARLQSDEGLSFTEFSYQLLQAYDFYHLFVNHGVSVQLGGSDQWGNITAGIELVRKLTGKTVYGVTLPLLTKSDGQKFGKSVSGALWLHPEKLSPYELYQQLIRVDDSDVIRFLKMLTFVDMSHICTVEREMREPGYEPNKAQKLLASELVQLLHGPDNLQKALQATAQMRPGSQNTALTPESLEALVGHIPGATLPRGSVEGRSLLDLLVEAQFLPSKGEVRRLIRNNGLFLNNRAVTDEAYCLTTDDLVGDRFVLFSFGKKNKALLHIKE